MLPQPQLLHPQQIEEHQKIDEGDANLDPGEMAEDLEDLPGEKGMPSGRW